MLPFGLAVGVAVAVVLCITVLVLLVLFGIKRYGTTLSTRLTAKPAGDDKQEMEWDNSELNITVNPLEGECAYEDEIFKQKLDSEDTVNKEEDACEQSEAEEEKEATKCPEGKELEWDDSTLSY